MDTQLQVGYFIRHDVEAVLDPSLVRSDSVTFSDVLHTSHVLGQVTRGFWLFAFAVPVSNVTFRSEAGGS